MFAIVLAALAAAIWGVADYCGGVAARRASVVGATFVVNVGGMALCLLWLAVAYPGGPLGAEVAWAFVAGALGTLGLGLFYAGMALGAMTIVAPISAVTGAALPVIGGLLLGEHPSAIALTSVVCAIAAIALISWERHADEEPGEAAPSESGRVARGRVITLALVSGAAFGVYFTAMDFAAVRHGSPWPVLTEVTTGTVAVAGYWLWRRWRSPEKRAPRRLAPAPGLVAWGAPGGVLLALGAAFYLAAIGRGELTIIGPIAALYPATTVLMALVREKERRWWAQGAGLALAGAALVLASAG
jgi:drug/metabolite transporter (DMT)-like permease